jgi:ATP synthase protein I
MKSPARPPRAARPRDAARTSEERRRDRDEHFLRTIAGKEARYWRSLRERNHTLLLGLGMFGLVGWSVAVPTLLGIALGLWIDRAWPSSYSWTLMLLLGGVVAGCLNAWHWLKRTGSSIKGTKNR